MNREVELVLSGLHASGQEQESEAVETVQPAQYFKRNDSHYLLYEEKMDKDQAPCRSRIKFRDHLLELTRQGTAEMHMIFEENKRHMIPNMDLQAAFAQGFSLMIQRVFHRHVNLILLFLYQYPAGFDPQHQLPVGCVIREK